MRLQFRFFFCVSLLLGLCNNAMAHKEPTHQYIVREAYELLKIQLGGDIPIMEDFVGTTEGRGMSEPWERGELVAGVWDEDVHDIIFHKDDEKTVSTSHFWDADAGPNSEVEILIKIIHFRFFTFEHSVDKGINAYQKLMRYLDGGFTIRHSNKTFVYSGLINLYKTGQIKHFQRVGGGGGPRGDRETKVVETSTTVEALYGLQSTDLSLRRKFVFNILGRMCHLLGDMSVPAHAHVQQHACPRDLFENNMNVEFNTEWNPNGAFPKYWNAANTYETKGGLINPYNNCSGEDPIYRLMYSTNQVADCFPSYNSPFRFHKHPDENWTTSTQPLFSSFDVIEDAMDGISDWVSHPGVGDYFHNEIVWDDCVEILLIPACCEVAPSNEKVTEIGEMRDATFRLAIRATAGLLYYFAVEAGLLENTCVAEQLYLQNKTITTGSYLHQASQAVWAGSNVNVNATQGPYILSGGTTTFRSPEKVILQDGFRASADFHAFLGPCTGYGCQMNPSVMSPKLEVQQTIVKHTIDINVLDQQAKHQETYALSLYPNPANDHVAIQFQLPLECHATLRLIDLKGEIVLQESVASKEEALLHVGNLPAGPYTVILECGSIRLTKQLIVH